MILDYNVKFERNGRFIAKTIQKTALGVLIINKISTALSNITDIEEVTNTWDAPSIDIIQKLLAEKQVKFRRSLFY